MMGEKPSFLKKLILKPAYKPIFDEAVAIAAKNRATDKTLIDGYYHSLQKINDQLYAILTKRLENKFRKQHTAEYFDGKSFENFIEKLELPSNIRAYTDAKDKTHKREIDVSEFLDGLSCPFFGAVFILAAHFTSAKTMFHTRPLLRDFAERMGKYQHPKRIMWLTDTFVDGNGVSVFLQEMLAEIRKHNLPIDIVACSSEIKTDANLIVLPPVKEFELPAAYGDYTLAIPNFVELHNLFLANGYDRIICSTEGIMGLFGLYLKHAYTVEASFYMHTDWLMFARKALGIEGHYLNRIRRILRWFYKQFDGVFVLNSDQKKWLSGNQMNLNPDKIFQTAHWVNEIFQPVAADKKSLFGIENNRPVLLYVGRVSKEKGVLEVSQIYRQAKHKFPDLLLVVVGKGPALPQMKDENPDAVFMDWIAREKLPAIYSSADLLLLPSRFDTFSNVVLEALSCGLPVIAYNTKGPKDIIRDSQDGFLVNTLTEMLARVEDFFENKNKKSFRKSAVERAGAYIPETIISGVLKAVGLN
jgi:glycosyltransferase involved in cell wall biosynthesis